ncbi:MAG: prephenate dehydratase [Paludibacteraceae bacterium]|nr:prephenate dehydratase [Paludibacteraceae bacterium]
MNDRKKIAIQGIAGCFHDCAARLFFQDEEIDLVPCESFPVLFDKVTADPQMLAIVAIENTIAGSLLQNYELIRNSGLSIVGEHKLRIRQSLCALPGQRLDSLDEVLSHPIALLQCNEFLRQHPQLRIIEFDDTANAARTIAEKQMTGAAAICASLAARQYGLEVLEEGIETNKHNFTRFLILSHQTSLDSFNAEPNKSSLAFAVPHKPGSLSKILTILSFYDINLTKIQSMPIIGKEWQYLFYIDLSYDNYERYHQALNAIMPLTRDLRVLGDYHEGRQTI